MIETYTDEQLQEELSRRKRKKEAMKKPKQVRQYNLVPLRKHCQNHIDSLEAGTARADDEHYIYEVAMITIFGKNVFDWINERTP